MSAHLPTIKQLQYLVALQAPRAFRPAAEACFVSQSTLSAGIRELEALLGVALVERTRRVVRFTPSATDRRQGGRGCCARPRSSPSWRGPRASRCMASCAWA